MPKKVITTHRNNGLKIQMLRKRAGLTQKQLAQKLGISAVYIGYIEQGREKPSKRTLDKIFKLVN